MINIKLGKGGLFENKTDSIVKFVSDDSYLKDQNILNLQPNIEKILSTTKFKSNSNSVVFVPTLDFSRFLILASLGKKKKDNLFDVELLRRVVAKVIRSLDSHAVKSIAIELPDSKLYGQDEKYIAQQVASILHISDYIFDDYITDKDRKQNSDFTITIYSESKDVETGVHEGSVIGKAVNKARHWVDLPPRDLTPMYLSHHAQEIAKEFKLDITVFTEDQIIKMGMGGLAGVASGSEQECRFVIMEYKYDKSAPTVGIVGKGITFDSGGLSIKPADNMETMKDDMSGAAAVIATMKAIAQLKPNVNVVAFAPMTENLPGDGATKPGDILTFYNGKTAEIKNTDAEGRLILADALSYAVKNYDLDVIVDAATLTGACAYALGPYFTGLFSEHEEVVEKIEKAAKRSGDFVWRLPLTDDYKSAVKSEVADLCNIGKRNVRAGGTTAACFLQHFVDDVPWAHLDIAGTAFDVPNIPYYRSWSATGSGIRLFIDFIMNYKN